MVHTLCPHTHLPLPRSRPKYTCRSHCTFRKKIKLPALPLAKTSRFWINSHVDLGEAGLSTIKLACDRHFCSLQGRSKAVVVELVYYPNSDIIEKVIERTDAEFIQTFRSCKITIVINGKPKEHPVPKWWLDLTDRNVKAEVYRRNSQTLKHLAAHPLLFTMLPRCASQLEFVTVASEREQLSAAGKLSCFNGLRLDGSEPVDYGTAAAHHGVLRIVFHIETFLANDVPEVSAINIGRTFV